MIQQGYGSTCICDKCGKVIKNMEYVQIKSIFPYKPNSKISSNTHYKYSTVMELCYDCYVDLIDSLFENGFISEAQKIIILNKKKSILNDYIKEETK